MEVSGEFHVLACFPQKKDAQYPLARRLGSFCIHSESNYWGRRFNR